MKSRILTLLLSCAGASLAHADYNPVELTPSSYTFDIVVEATSPQSLPDCINVTTGNGKGKQDYSFFEQGFYTRPGTPGGNCGLPHPGTTFTSFSDATKSFVMPPDYTTNNTLLIDVDFPTGTLDLKTATTATNLSILVCGGGGAVTFAYTVNHADGVTVDTGSMTINDWYNTGTFNAWGAVGRVSLGGGFSSTSTTTPANTAAPFMDNYQITVSGASPVTTVSFTYTSGAHANIYSISANASGTLWTPVVVGGYNVRAIVPATFPLTATMDQGTNTVNNGNLATWFEQGFVRGTTSAGLPPSGSTFNSATAPTHHYKMGDYTKNNAILIDTNHLTANITPLDVTKTYSTFALLTAGGNVGSIPMTNLCILQHKDGVNETNVFLGRDWFNNDANSSIAYYGNGRVNMYSRTVNNVGNGYPYLFESYFPVLNGNSPVTNILLKYQWANGTSATTYIMAVSASSGAEVPSILTGPIPTSQTFYPGQGATFVVTTLGATSGYWQMVNGDYRDALVDGTTASGSIVKGSQTTSLTITNLTLADSTNYEYVAVNGVGSTLSTPATLIVNPQTISIAPDAPTFYKNNTFTLTVTTNKGAPVTLQWYTIDTSGVSNSIPGATNLTYTITNATLGLSGMTYGVVASNFYGVNVANDVITILDSAATLAADLTPPVAEAYVGATVTYGASVKGNSPITYKWLINGVVVNGATSNLLTYPVACGTNTIQVQFTNALSAGIWATSSIVTMIGDASPAVLTFSADGSGWQTNAATGVVPIMTNNMLTLTDNGTGEGSSAYYKTAQYVGGAWTASFTYNSHAGGADGAAFVLQNSPTNIYALGGTGGAIGYGGVINSLALELNIYNGNGNVPGMTLATNGTTGTGSGYGYLPVAPVSLTTTNPINVSLSYANGVLAVVLNDPATTNTYATNYNIGALTPILMGNLAYVGFTGGDGGSTSTQTINNFQFHSVLAPISLSVSPVTAGTVTLSWSAADTNYKLQQTSSLTTAFTDSTVTPTVVGGVNNVIVTLGNSGQQFYRLTRKSCQ